MQTTQALACRSFDTESRVIPPELKTLRGPVIFFLFFFLQGWQLIASFMQKTPGGCFERGDNCSQTRSGQRFVCTLLWIPAVACSVLLLTQYRLGTELYHARQTSGATVIVFILSLCRGNKISPRLC